MKKWPLLYLLILFGFVQVHALNKPQRIEWLQDAGFGMFIHWSMDSQLGSVISHSAVGASKEYLHRYFNELPRTFNPQAYDPEEWVVLAKLAGMKYMVFTTKHHSGFCMWDTKTTPFNVMNTPYGQDIVAQYVDACRKHDMAVGFYYSPEDFWWLHQHNIRITRRGEGSDPAHRSDYADYIRTQMKELMSNYGKIDVLFFDGKGDEIAREVAWSLQPDVLVTRGAMETPEQTLPGIPMTEPWEACITMGTQWQYKPTNENYKSGGRLIELLIETRAKGGALLLNVGPKPNGELPIEQEARLREIALWHFVNQNAIHGVRPWVVTHEGDIWFVLHKTEPTVYAFLTGQPDWPRGERRTFIIKSVKTTIETQIEVLGQSSEWVEYQPETDASVRVEQFDDRLEISCVRAQRLYNNQKWPNPIVLEISHAEPALSPPVVQTESYFTENGDIVIEGELIDNGRATVQVGFQYRQYAGFVEELYQNEWKQTKLLTSQGTGPFQIPLQDLEPGTVYQYRAMVKHPLLTIYGDVKRFETP